MSETEKKSRAKSSKKAETFTAEERAAMKERSKELKAGKVDGETAVMEKLAEMSGTDRTMGERVHAIIKAHAPSLSPKLWYGMPAYAKDGKVVCFFQSAEKFGARYATLGFNDTANLDDGAMWATAFALKDISPAEEAKIAELVKKALVK